MTTKQQKELLKRKGNMLLNNKLAWALIQDYLKVCKEQNKILDIKEFYYELERQFENVK